MIDLFHEFCRDFQGFTPNLSILPDLDFQNEIADFFQDCRVHGNPVKHGGDHPVGRVVRMSENNPHCHVCVSHDSVT